MPSSCGLPRPGSRRGSPRSRRAPSGSTVGPPSTSRLPRVSAASNCDSGSASTASSATSAPPWIRRAWRSVLSHAHRAQFLWSATLEDLTRCVDAAQRSIDLTAAEDPRIGGRLSAFATAMRLRFQHTGDLGIALRLRAEQTKREEDLNESVGAARAALAIAPEHDSQLTSFQLNLATALGTRYRYLHHRPDNDEAISLLRGVIDSEQALGGPSPSRLGNLSVMLRMRYQRNGDPGDVTEAVLLARCAVDRISPGTPLKPNCGRRSQPPTPRASTGRKTATMLVRRCVRGGMPPHRQHLHHAIASTPHGQPESWPTHSATACRRQIATAPRSRCSRSPPGSD